MKTLAIKSNPAVEEVIGTYPEIAQRKLMHLRQLILEAAEELDGLNTIEETLKWGEPSYLAKKGSTIRIAWKAKAPEQYAIYFKCTSKLVPTFKEIFGELFKYEGNRAILFDLDEEIPRAALKQCVQLALTYHNVKHLPLLGI